MAKPEMITVEVFVGLSDAPFFRCDVSPNFRMSTVLALARDAREDPPAECTLEHRVDPMTFKKTHRLHDDVTITVEAWRRLVGSTVIGVRLVDDQRCMHSAPPGYCGYC